VTSRNPLVILVLLLMIAPMILSACGSTPEPEVLVETVVVQQTRVVEVEGEAITVVETVEVEKPVEVQVLVEVTATPEPVDRVGGWFDTVIFVEEPDADMAVTRLEAGDIDVFAYGVSEPSIAQRIFESDALAYEMVYGGSNELTFTPSTTPEFNDGRLNPFYSDKIREAMNWLIDRDYIVQDILGGLAVPQYVPIFYASKDTALLAEAIAAIELKYAHDPDKAVEVISAEMEALGATLVDGKWTYKDEPVVLTALIRVEDERREIGDYVSNLLEDIGFTVQREYVTMAECAPCWLLSDPDEGCTHFYTGGWITITIVRDQASAFRDGYTPDGLPVPPWQAYTPVPEFYEIATRLGNSDFASMGERAELMTQALHYALEDSQRIWLKGDVGIAPHAADISLASDLAGGISGSSLWAHTMRREGQVGGSVTIAVPSISLAAWNPFTDVGSTYAMMVTMGTQDNAFRYDPYTGLPQPTRLERAEVTVQEGLPVDVTLDWVTLEFVPQIVVPEDAWADWDAENQVFVTAGERFTTTQTAASKVVMYYEDDLFDKMTWHDGSPLTLADVVMTMILAFDRSKEASPYYDEASVPGFRTDMAAFKGWKIASEDPLVIEYYTDAYQLDAENSVSLQAAAYPWDGAAWHVLVPGLWAEAGGWLAFSAAKAAALEVEQTSFIAGPSLEILKAELDAAQEEAFIPFEPTLGQYISTEEAAARYDNLQEWVRRYGHFWIGTGPYFLQRAFPVEGTIILRHNPDYPDLATRWDRWTTAPLPEVFLDGPGSVTLGGEAIFDLFVTFQDQPYPVGDIDMVKFLIVDASGELAYAGEGQAVEDGHWQAVLSADLTAALGAGSNRFAAIVVSKRAVIPVSETVQFVTQ
jgi:peptide/nickel transport system substrate-binding protein